MPDKSAVSNNIISLPKGGGEIKGLGEKFQPDLFTGTVSVTIPITVPPGRNQFQPQLSLEYNTGTPNGPFGLGWNVAVPTITRKTSTGIPRYIDSDGEYISNEDAFILEGVDELISIDGKTYRPRIETAFARIEKIRAPDGQFCWSTTTRDGVRTIYGKDRDSRIYFDDGNRDKIFSWLCSERVDVFGNKIKFSYRRDIEPSKASVASYPSEMEHSYNQTYLHSIEYVECPDSKFMWMIEFDYGDYDETGVCSKEWDVRPDRFSTHRPGFELRTVRRCKRILIKQRSDKLQNGYNIIRSYSFSYIQDEFSNISLLSKVVFSGYAERDTEAFPPLEFNYTEFKVAKLNDIETLSFEPVNSNSDNTFICPDNSIGKDNFEVMDLFGTGLPCIVKSTRDGWWYWKNLGQNRFAAGTKLATKTGDNILSDRGVLLNDLDGDGSIELLVTIDNENQPRGYYEKNDLIGEWNRFVPYKEQVLNFENPEIRLVDLDGDGILDLVQTIDDTYYFRKNARNTKELKFEMPVLIPRHRSTDTLPRFGGDEDVRLADITGDGLQDIIRITIDDSYRIHLEYWPNQGYGRFGKKISMNSMTIASCQDINNRRVFFADVNGDGVTDIVYIDISNIYIWINQSGNDFSVPIVISNTPPVLSADIDSIRIIDLKGTGNPGILWSHDISQIPNHYRYLGLVRDTKPHLLNSIDNNIGSKTIIHYQSSTEYFLQDELNHQKMPEKYHAWATHLPFPLQVVSDFQVIDEISKSKMTSRFEYHHGYWDGVEHEFSGFGRVDELDSTTFQDFNNNNFQAVNISIQEFNPPTQKRTWFHQGPIKEGSQNWKENDFSREFWLGDRQILKRPKSMTEFLEKLEPPVKHDALRSLRGRILRTELYAQDRSSIEDSPYTVTEYLHGIMSLPIGQKWPNPPIEWQKKVFFPCTLAERITQWERGNDPMTQFRFSGNYDMYGQVLSYLDVAVPRHRDFMVQHDPGVPYLATLIKITYSQRDDVHIYIVDRICSNTTYQIQNDGSDSVFELKKKVHENTAELSCVAQTLYFYDGKPFDGLKLGQLGQYGALVRKETLVLNEDILRRAYNPAGNELNKFLIPSNLFSEESLQNENYLQEFRNVINRLEYTFRSKNDNLLYEPGYFASESYKYDFHDERNILRGLVRVKRDPLKHDTIINYDEIQLFPTEVITGVLRTRATYDYSAFSPKEVVDPNENRTLMAYSPLGYPQSVWIMGEQKVMVGDTPESPSVIFEYDLNNYVNNKKPIYVSTIRRRYHASGNDKEIPADEINKTVKYVEYSDGFGRIVQSRTQADEFVVKNFDPNIQNSKIVIMASFDPLTKQPLVRVDGWKVYDNKGNVIERYEPFFSHGWEYEFEESLKGAQKVKLYYDPRGQLTRTVNPDGSENRVILGIPRELNIPDIFEPTPWETYNYDANDNAGRTHPQEGASYKAHWNTPSTFIVDSLGRKIRLVERMNSNGSSGEFVTQFEYDIQGRLVKVVDPLNRITLSYVHDLTGKVLRNEQLDTGVKAFFFDAAANLIKECDSKGAIRLRQFDQLNRNVALWARDNSHQPISLRCFVIYGDDEKHSKLSFAKAKSLNLLGRIYKQYDETGLLIFAPDEKIPESTPYDFKGNVLEKVRRVIKDEILLTRIQDTKGWGTDALFINWDSSTDESLKDPEDILDERDYRTSFRYNAFNQIRLTYFPEDPLEGKRSRLHQLYNSAGLVQQVSLEDKPFLQLAIYNAKGQPLITIYGNETVTAYEYDQKTFRLLSVKSQKYTNKDGHPDTYDLIKNPFQDVNYIYDLVGNIMSINDRSIGSRIHNFTEPTGSLKKTYTYDPFYRLISSTGMEHKVRREFNLTPWNKQICISDIKQPQYYLEQYGIDAVGNMTTLCHLAENNDKKLEYSLYPNSNQICSMKLKNERYDYSYDGAGNINSETSTRRFVWDHLDRLIAFINQPEHAEPSIYAQYLYDSEGNRVKKVVRKQGGHHLEMVTYIDKIFEHHTVVKGVQKLENVIYHIGDEKKIGSVRVGRAFPDDESPPVKYYITDHLGSHNIVLDSDGMIIDIEDFTPFGETAFGGFIRKQYRFSGKEYDEESRLYYFGARYYASWICRWISCDPLASERPSSSQTYHPYSYVDNKPTVAVDPDGKIPIIIWIAIGIGAGILSESHANTPERPTTRTFVRTSYVETAAQAALLVIGIKFGTAVGGSVSKWIAKKTSSAIAVGATEAAVSGGVSGGITAPGSRLISNVARGQSSPPSQYAADAGWGALIGATINLVAAGVLGGIRSLIGGSKATSSVATPSASPREPMTGTAAAATSSGSTGGRITLFRAVDSTELQYLLKSGNYGASPSQAGKYFAFTEEGARRFAGAEINANQSMTVTRIDVPESFVEQYGYKFIDVGQQGAGPSVHFAQEVLEQLYNVSNQPKVITSPIAPHTGPIPRR